MKNRGRKLKMRLRNSAPPYVDERVIKMLTTAPEREAKPPAKKAPLGLLKWCEKMGYDKTRIWAEWMAAKFWKKN